MAIGSFARCLLPSLLSFPEVLPMKESRRRSVMNVAVSLGIGVIEGIAKVFWYYMHERL